MALRSHTEDHMSKWPRRALLLAVACLAASGAQAAANDQPLGSLFEDFQDSPLTATSVEFCWSGDGTENADSWAIRRAAGTAPPPSDAAPIATLPGGKGTVCYKASGLVTDNPYTFSIVGHNETGDSNPGNFTLAARAAGNFVLVPGSTQRLPGSLEYNEPRLAFSQRGHRLHAVYLKLMPDKHAYGLYHSERGKGGWTKPQIVSPDSLMQLDVSFASNPAGTVVAGWNTSGKSPSYRVKRAGAARFGARHRLPNRKPGDNLDALAVDRRGHLHALVTRSGFWPRPGLFYLTNASGRWRESAIPKSTCLTFNDGACERPSLLAYDPVTDGLVVVEQHNGIRIASKRADAPKFGPLRRATAANRRHLLATAVTSRGGRVTLGLRPLKGGGLYVWSSGRIARVPGTSSLDDGFLVAAASPDRVQLAWQRTSPAWNRKQQGIWTAQRALDRKTGRWSFGAARHRTDSAYDRLGALTVDARGRALAGYGR
jgi:hypothetical protein